MNLLKLAKKVPQSASLSAGEGIKLVFGQCPFKWTFFQSRLPLRLVHLSVFLFTSVDFSPEMLRLSSLVIANPESRLCFPQIPNTTTAPQRTATNIDNIFYHLLCGRTKVQHSTGGLQVGPTTHFQIFFPPLLAVLKLQHYSKVHFPPTLSFTFSFGRWQRRVSPLCSGSGIRSRRFLLCTTLLLLLCSIRVLSKT